MEYAMLASWERTRAEHEGSSGSEQAPATLEKRAVQARLGEELFGEPASESLPTLGRFQLVRRIGSGAMGVVFEGYDAALGRRVALKVLRSDVAAKRSLQARSRMMREAQALARLRHPNVTMIYEVGTGDDEAPFIAMELVEGRTLKRWLRARPRSCREIVDVFMQAGRGLAAAHEAGLVHRDFKPDNVIIDDRGHATVVDFGLARSAGLGEMMPTLDDADSGPIALHLTCTGAILGTPAYMAPEQFQGGPAHATSDQFSFCVALFEALYGRRPYPGNDLPSLQRSLVRGRVVGPRRGVPRRLYRVLRRGLSTEAASRYPSMDALLDALEACQQRSRVHRSAVLVAGLALAAVAGTLLPASPADPAPAAVTQRAQQPSVAPEAVPVVARVDGPAWTR